VNNYNNRGTLLDRAAKAMSNITVIGVCCAVLAAMGYLASQHINCVDFFQKFCVIH
jgi:hypothetical protein